MFNPKFADIVLLSATVLMGLLFVATRGSAMQETYLALSAIGLIIASLLLERVVPQHAAWNDSKHDVKGDIASFVVIIGVLDSALKWLVAFAFLALVPAVGWGFELPLWVQIILATLVIELGAWLSHYAHHRSGKLWQLHSMHHSTERLYTMNNFRFHPFNYVLNHIAAFIPPLVLGLSPEAVLGYVVLTMPALMFQHSNVRAEFGVVNRLFTLMICTAGTIQRFTAKARTT